MDYIKLAQRTIAMLSSMIESGECHTTRSKEMKDNALNGLEQLRIHGVVRQIEQFACLCPRTKYDDCDREMPCKECEGCKYFRQANCT